jgi:hypothetical protein
MPPRAPIPPYGHNEWHARPELLNALDEYDAEMLAKMLRLARKNLMSALVVGAVYVAHASLALVHVANGALSDAVLAMLMAAGWWWVARLIHRDARALRDAAYREAERALEAKLARDERPTVLRTIGNLAAVEAVLGLEASGADDGANDAADEELGGAA